MPADSLTTRRANRHVCCPLIFIELFPEQLFYNRHDVTSRKNRLLLRRAGSRPALLATVGVFRSPPPPRQAYLGYDGRECVLVRV